MEGSAGGDDDVVYVIVGKVVEESKLTLLWAANKFKNNTLCILYVHQPAKRHKSFSVGRYSSNGTEEHGAKEVEKKIMQRVMDEYLLICNQAGVSTDRLEKLCIEKDDIQTGIVELINDHNIKKLVMEAAADKHYFEGMDQMVELMSEKAQYVYRHIPLFCQVWFICQGQLIRCISRDGTGRSGSASSIFTCSSEVTRNSDMQMHEGTAESESGDDDLPTSNDQSSKEELYVQLEQAISEAEKEKSKAFEESMRRMKAEKASVRAMRRAEELDRLCTESQRRMRETGVKLAEQEAELENIKQERDEERLISMDQKKLMESQLTSSEYLANELQMKLSSTLEQLITCQKERDDLQAELGNAEKRIDEILMIQEGQQFFNELSLSEIRNATKDFDPSSKIGSGSDGSLYKGSLHHTTVAIKVLQSSSLPSEFQREADRLSRLRHPNLATLMGTCPDISALIYEYLPNGSLEDWLSCRDDTSPLPWQTRIHIVTDLCLVLIFLRTCKPHAVVHGNLKPSSILLDANFVCKLSDFGACHSASHPQNSTSINDPNNIYTDPEFFTTGGWSPSSDIYSFGIILLQLLTGRAPLHIAEDVQHALNVGELNAMLDPSAGCWPYVQAAQLSHLALRCCAASRSRRPDLASEVLTVLEPIRASCEASSSLDSSAEVGREPPEYFLCPIYQDIMRDPHIAADGFTYEAEALREWLQRGNNTSPMTNVRLAHDDLIPNFALRSAIREWMQGR